MESLSKLRNRKIRLRSGNKVPGARTSLDKGDGGIGIGGIVRN